MKAVALIVIIVTLAVISQTTDLPFTGDSTSNSLAEQTVTARFGKCAVGSMYFEGKDSSANWCNIGQSTCWPQTKTLQLSGFPTTPNMIAAITQLDAGETSGTIRVAVSVDNVTPHSASVTVNKWADSLLYSVAVNYVICGAAELPAHLLKEN